MLIQLYKYTKNISELCNNFKNVSYYHVSCLDELYYKLIELDNKNKILKKLYYLGFVLEHNEVYISFNTSSILFINGLHN